jgi:phosphate/sulfate permease
VLLGDDPRAGPAIGALAVGLAAWLGWRTVLAALASLLGALALLGGALAGLPGPVPVELSERPRALLLLAVVLAAIGMAFQHGAAGGAGKTRKKVSPADPPADP